MRLLPLTTLLVLLASASARGDGGSAGLLETAPREHFQRGEQFYRTGEWRAARVEFQAGYELSRNPVFLWNLAKTAAKSGDRKEALDFARRFRASLDAPDAEVDAFIKQLGEQGDSFAAPAPPKPPPAPPRGRRSPVLPALLVSLGAALLAADLAVAVGSGQLTARNQGAQLSPTELAELNARGNALNVAAWTLLPLGLGSVTAGVVLFVLR